MKRAIAAVMLGMLAVALTACNRDSNAVPSDAAVLIRAQIANARNAAAEGHYTDSIANVRHVEQVVADLRARHDILPARADEIQAAAAALDAALQRYLPPTTTTTSPPTTTPVPPPAPADHGHKARKHGGKGQGGD